MAEFNTDTLVDVQSMSITTAIDGTLGEILNGNSESEIGTLPVAEDSGVAPVDILPTILEDHAFFRQNLPRAAIQTLNKDYCTVVIM
jgi:hypothetical protein